MIVILHGSMGSISGIGKYSEQEMISGLKQANHGIFTLLYSNYFPMLLLSAEKYVKDVFVAEEIVQDVFIKMWENPASLDSVSVLRPYLYRSVVNQCLNYLSRQKTIEKHHFIIAEQMTDENIQDLYDEQELKIIIYNEIERLPQQCRKVFKMSRFEGLKYKEIAVALNISEKTVENHVVNALRILRPRLLDQASATHKLYNSSACLAIVTLLGYSSSFLNSNP